MKRKIAAALVVAMIMALCVPFCTPLTASALDMPNVQEIFDKAQFTDSTGYTINYRIFLPEDYSEDKEYPLLLFFHGAGSKGNDNESQLNAGVQQMFTYSGGNVRNSIVIAPQCPLLSPDTAKWVDVPNWVDGCKYSTMIIPESTQMKAVVELLGYVRDTYSTDESRWYVTGLSMGGFATWDIIVRHPELWAAAVPLCGGADYRKASVIKDLPIWTFHGDQDPTVPIHGTNEMVAALKAAGSTVVKYNVLQGQKHDIWNGVYSYTSMWTWMYKQQKAMPEVTETQATVTEPQATETQAAVTDLVTEPPVESGCASALGTSVLTLTAVAAGAVALTKKKKRK